MNQTNQQQTPVNTTNSSTGVTITTSSTNNAHGITATTTSNGSIKKIFIQRDYSQGIGVRFLNKFPNELEGRIDRQQYEHLINTMNTIYSNAEKMSTQTFCESCFACISAYILYVCMETYYQKCMRKITAFIDEQNDTVWKPRGLLITDPMERGLRVIEIAFLDQTVNGEQIAPPITQQLPKRNSETEIKSQK